MYFTRDSPCDENKQPYQTGSVAARVKTAPSAVHQDGGVKYATGALSKIHERHTTIGPWNTRALRAAGKFQELTHEMDRHKSNILALCKMRWKNFAETTTEEGHKIFLSGKKHKGVGFLVHKDIVNTDVGCHPVSRKLITVGLRAVSSNITDVQAYVPTSDNEIEKFYDQLQKVVGQTPKEDILVVQGDWNAKVGKDANENWQNICVPFCIATRMREDSDFWILQRLTIWCWRTLLVITEHPEDGPGIAQKDNATIRLITF